MLKSTPNLFAEIGIGGQDIDKRIEDTFHAIFEDPEDRFYFTLGDDAGFFMDTGNIDARTEGMSYGMMMAVQMDRQDLFDRFWQFSMRYMYLETGINAGYFAWSVKPDGTRNSNGPAPDGEEYYAMALFFASARWGDKEPPFDYAEQARAILRHAVHQPELVPGGHAMWDEETALIRFVPGLPFSDPSYHLPHFYDRFALLADEKDHAFWRRAAQASRDYLPKTCHPLTGLAPEYAHYDGTPETEHGHGDFFSDAYRVAMNIGLDSAWSGQRAAYKIIADNMQAFLWDKEPHLAYSIDGTPKKPQVKHPTAIVCTTAAASLATDTALSRQWVKRFWDTPPSTGRYRYYDNCLYFFCLLMLGGRYALYA